MYGSLSCTGLTSWNVLFIFVRLRHRSTWIRIQHVGSSHSLHTPFQSRRAPVRVVLSGRSPVPPVGSRLESRSAALGGFSATTTSTIKRRCAVSRSVFVWEVCLSVCPVCVWPVDYFTMQLGCETLSAWNALRLGVINPRRKRQPPYGHLRPKLARERPTQATCIERSFQVVARYRREGNQNNEEGTSPRRFLWQRRLWWAVTHIQMHQPYAPTW